jgi:WD40 repeat protein
MIATALGIGIGPIVLVCLLKRDTHQVQTVPEHGENLDRGGKPWPTFEEHTGLVRGVAISPDGKTIASGSADKSIKLWDVSTGENTATLKAARYGVSSVAFSPDGRTLASGYAANQIQLWDVATRKDTTLFDDKSQYAAPQVVFSPDGKTLASGGRCIQEIRLWDVTTGKQTATLAGHDEYGVPALAFTPDGRTLASVGYHGGIKLWDVATGKNTATLKTDDNEETYVPAAAFSPDTKTLAAVCPAVTVEEGGRNVVKDQACIKLWEVATGKEQATLKGQTANGWPMVFSPDGKTLATGSKDNTIKLWDVATGKELATFKGHTGTVLSLAFSEDSRMLVSGSEDKTIKLWDVDRGARAEGGRPTKLDRKDLSQLWDDLAGEDAGRAFRAVQTLGAAPEAADYLKEHLQPVPDDRFPRLIADLDDSRFEVRAAARRELGRRGALAEPALRVALEGRPPLEVRQQVEDLLVPLTEPPLLPEVLRHIRGVQVLEHMDTPAARDVLHRLARGAPGARLTQEAKAALGRLARGPSKTPDP